MGSFECGSCCQASTYSVPLSDTYNLGVFNAVMSVFGFLTLVVLVLRLTWLFRRGMERSQHLMSNPILYIRDKKQKEKTFLLPWYFGYSIFLTVILFIEAICAFVQNGGVVLEYLTKVVAANCELLDNLILAFLVLPRITLRGKIFVYAFSFSAFIAFFLFMCLHQTNQPCEWCSLHYTQTDVYYFYCIEAVLCGFVFLWATFRPFKTFNPRPMAR